MGDRLLRLLRERAHRAGEVRLSSGRRSTFFIDCKRVVLMAEGHALVGEALRRELAALDPAPSAVAGVELGGCPLASAVACCSAGTERPYDAVYVRKKAKEHGSRRELEGADHLPPGARVVVLEDVVTTGASTLRAIERLRAHGLDVVHVAALVDREEGGAAAIRGAGVTFSALYSRADFTGEGERG